MTDDKRNRGTGKQPQQGQQQGQGQFGQGLQPDRQPGQQGRTNETTPRQSLQGEGSASNRQARQAHRDPLGQLHSGQRTGGIGEEQAMAQGSLPGGFKSARTWTQTSGGQQATQNSLEGGQWPEQARNQPQQQPQQSQHLQQGQPEVSASTHDVRQQIEQSAAERRDSQGWHPEEGSHQQQRAGSQGGIEDAGSPRQHNQDARSQASGEFLEQRQGLRGEREDAATPRQRSLGQHASSPEEQQQQRGAGTDRQPGSGGQRADAIADRMEGGDDDGGKSGGRAGRRR